MVRENLLFKKKSYGRNREKRLDKSTFFVVKKVNDVWVKFDMKPLIDLENYANEDEIMEGLDEISRGE